MERELFILVLLCLGLSQCTLWNNKRKCCGLIDPYTKKPNCDTNKACSGDYCVNWDVEVHGHRTNIFGCMDTLPYVKALTP